jgi:hypothetical protein
MQVRVPQKWQESQSQMSIFNILKKNCLKSILSGPYVVINQLIKSI